MTEREKLNSILRLRLFCSTEHELSKLTGIRLQGNHFNHLTRWKEESYYARFGLMAREETLGHCDLDELLVLYKGTSEFYCRHIRGTQHADDGAYMAPLLQWLFTPGAPLPADRRLAQLCGRYAAKEKGDELSPAILALLTLKVLPTFNKGGRDIADIVGDCRSAHAGLTALAMALLSPEQMQFVAPQSLDEMARIIDREACQSAAGETTALTRVWLIWASAQVMRRIQAVYNPSMLLEQTAEARLCALPLPRLLRCKDEPLNVVWETEPLEPEGCCNLWRHEIGPDAVRSRCCQLLVSAQLPEHDVYKFTFLRPGFHYNNLLGRPAESGTIGFDHPVLTRDPATGRIRKLHFLEETPAGEGELLLEEVPQGANLSYYEGRLAEGVLPRIDKDATVAVAMEKIWVAVAPDCLIVAEGDDMWHLEKYDDEGAETVPGISALTHRDNFVLARLTDPEGRPRRFLCLDSINRNLDLDQIGVR